MTTVSAPAGLRIGPVSVPPDNRTLGDVVYRWIVEYLLQPDGPDAGQPFKPTREQSRFLLNWYALDERGRFVYRYGMLRRMKGWGKDPMGAVLCCVEFLGPCRFAGWRDGQPVAEPHSAAWIQTAAVSRDQTRNTMTLFPGMLSPKAITEYGIDLGKEIIYAERGRKRIEAVTSSPRALEGGRATFTLKNETHHWIGSNEGHEMAKVIARNAAKSRDGSSRVLAISNAHAPGEDSDAEHDWETWRKIDQGVSKIRDVLYDSLEAPGDTDLEDDESLRAGILAARGDSHWLDADRLLAEIRDPRTTPAMARRFYLNQIVAEEDKPFDSERFAALRRDFYVPPDGAAITLGFDGSGLVVERRRDHTALIGSEIVTGHQWVAGYWEPEELPNGDLGIDSGAVDAVVADVFERYQVWRMNADPYKWGRWLSEWAGRYGADRIVSWPTTSYRKMAFALAQYRTAITAGDLSHDGDSRFVASIANSHKHMHHFRDDDGELCWTIQKERPDSPMKIDAAVAACLSWEARTAAIAAGANTPEEEVTVEFW